MAAKAIPIFMDFLTFSPIFVDFSRRYSEYPMFAIFWFPFSFWWEMGGERSAWGVNRRICEIFINMTGCRDNVGVQWLFQNTIRSINQRDIYISPISCTLTSLKLTTVPKLALKCQPDHPHFLFLFNHAQTDSIPGSGRPGGRYDWSDRAGVSHAVSAVSDDSFGQQLRLLLLGFGRLSDSA